MSVTFVVKQRVTPPSPYYTAGVSRSMQMRAMSFNPRQNHGSGEPGDLASSRMLLARCPLWPSNAPLSKAVTYLAATSAGLTYAKMFAISARDGKVMGRTAELTSLWGTTGRKEHALTADTGRSLMGDHEDVIWGLQMKTTTTYPQFARTDTPSGSFQSGEDLGWQVGYLDVGAVSTSGEVNQAALVWTPGTTFSVSWNMMLWGGFS